MTVTTEELTRTVIALVSGGFLMELLRWLTSLIKGRGARRSELELAWAKADTEAAKRRIVEEYASRITRRLIEAPCVDSNTIEPFPPYPKKES